MEFINIVKNLSEGAKAVFTGRNGRDKITVEHKYDYVYTVKLNNVPARHFLADEAAAWLDLYESKRGVLRQEEIEAVAV